MSTRQVGISNYFSALAGLSDAPAGEVLPFQPLFRWPSPAANALYRFDKQEIDCFKQSKV
jgi:hypothetical protein